jgi:hypothetical protein
MPQRWRVFPEISIFARWRLVPEHISTSIGYFFLAQVFAAQAQMEAALAFL